MKRCLLLLAISYGLSTDQITNHTNNRGTHSLSFNEVIRFGADDTDDNYFWTGLVQPPIVDASSTGDIFVADPKTNRVMQFDAKGQFKSLVAKQGEGPGEYTSLSWFQLLGDDSAIGFQNQQAVSRFSYFDSEQAFVKEDVHQDLKTIFARVNFAQNGQVFYATYISFDSETNTIVFKLGLFDKEYKLLRHLSQSPWPTPNPQKFNDPTYWEELIAEQMEGLVNRLNQFAVFLGNGNVMVVDADHYHMQLWSGDVKNQLAEVKNQYKPTPFSAEDRQAMIDWLNEIIFMQGGAQLQQLISTQTLKKAIDKAKLPIHQRPALFPLTVGTDHFAVVSRTSLMSGTATLDLFANDGKFVGHADLPEPGIVDLLGLRAVFKNDKLYLMAKDEDDDFQCVVYDYHMEEI